MGWQLRIYYCENYRQAPPGPGARPLATQSTATHDRPVFSFGQTHSQVLVPTVTPSQIPLDNPASERLSDTPLSQLRCVAYSASAGQPPDHLFTAARFEARAEAVCDNHKDEMTHPLGRLHSSAAESDADGARREDRRIVCKVEEPQLAS